MPDSDAPPLASLRLYTATALAASGSVIGRYSTSFSLACRTLPPAVRRDIAGIYALVRVAARPALPDADRVVELGREAHERRVDLARAEAHARRVQHAVGAPRDHVAARARVARDEVALPPHACRAGRQHARRG